MPQDSEGRLTPGRPQTRSALRCPPQLENWLISKDSDTQSVGGFLKTRYPPRALRGRFTPRKMQKVHARTHKDDAHDPEHSETALQLKAKVAELKSSVSSEAQRIIHEVMPKKV